MHCILIFRGSRIHRCAPPRSAGRKLVERDEADAPRPGARGLVRVEEAAGTEARNRPSMKDDVTPVAKPHQVDLAVEDICDESVGGVLEPKPRATAQEERHAAEAAAGDVG